MYEYRHRKHQAQPQGDLSGEEFDLLHASEVSAEDTMRSVLDERSDNARVLLDSDDGVDRETLGELQVEVLHATKMPSFGSCGIVWSSIRYVSRCWARARYVGRELCQRDLVSQQPDLGLHGTERVEV